MEESARKARNAQRMTTLYPTFAARYARVIQRLEDDGLRPRIQDAWRSPEDQLAAFNSGHSKLKFGFHNVTSATGKPEALAVDLLDDNAPMAPGKPYILKLAAAAAAEGLSTGVRWGLPAAMGEAIDRAIAAQNWKAPVKVGWDPLHVEPTGMTPQEAQQQNKRPV
jgi:hypothetical protein